MTVSKGHACPRSRSMRGRAPGKRGFTLIEMAIAISILTIGMVSVVSATSRMHSLRRQNRERTLVQNAVRSMTERIHATSYGFSDEPTEWATDLLGVFGPGGTVGDTFEVRGVSIVAGDPATGTIQFVTNETLTDDQLSRQVGMPRDLNGDGDADDADVSGNARVMPVLITVRWQGQSGIVTYEHSFYVTGY